LLVAQLRRLPAIQQRLRDNKRLFKSLLADLPGLTFRDLPDATAIWPRTWWCCFQNETVARAVTRELGSRVLAESGWHIYTQMEHLLSQRTASIARCAVQRRRRAASRLLPTGQLPQTDGWCVEQ